jgi:hypothetical protein
MLPPGAAVSIQERAELVYSAGNTTSTIASALGWTGTSVWLTEASRARIEQDHPEIVDLFAALATVLAMPDAVHRDALLPDGFYFIVAAAALRARGLLIGRRIRHVDLVIQSHPVDGTVLYRAFHLAPTRSNRGGAQLWP